MGTSASNILTHPATVPSGAPFTCRGGRTCARQSLTHRPKLPTFVPPFNLLLNLKPVFVTGAVSRLLGFQSRVSCGLEGGGIVGWCQGRHGACIENLSQRILLDFILSCGLGVRRVWDSAG